MSYLVESLASVSIGAFSLAISSSQIQRRSRRKKLSERINLTDEEIISHFFADSRLVEKNILLAWHKVADSLHVISGTLRPDDRISDLSGMPSWLVSYDSELTDTGRLLSYIFAKFPSEKLDENSIITIGDAVEMLSSE